MLKDNKLQRSIVITKELDEKIKQEAEELCTSSNCVIRKILTDYFKRKNGDAGKC